MRNYILQVKETSLNESFEMITGPLEEFKTFTSNLFLQIMDGFTTILQNFPK
jgi:hypothetical protein